MEELIKRLLVEQSTKFTYKMSDIGTPCSHYICEEVVMKPNTKIVLDYIITNINSQNNINLLFKDNLESKNIFSKNYNLEISSVGLQPIFKNNSFVSGVIDVSKFINNLGDIKLFDWNKFKTVIMDATNFLDNCIDSSYYINEDFENNIKNTRQIYLSITGYATLLIKLNIPFNSEDSLLFGEKLSEFVSYYSKYQSMIISKQKGPFLKYIKSKFDNIDFSFKTYTIQKTLFTDQKLAKKLLSNRPKVDWDELRNNIKKYGIRNSTTYSVIDSEIFSACNNCSNSINPLENLKNNYNINNKLISKINDVLLLNSDVLENNSEDEILDKLNIIQKKIFVKSKDIQPLFLIKLQNSFEKYSDGCCNLDININTDSDKDINKISTLIIQSYNLGNCVFSFKNNLKEDYFKLDNKGNRKSI
jgi:ribonucleoside-diphosphate reductase alpha chain